MEQLITQLKDHKSTNMKLLSTITSVCLSIAFATAAEVGAPIQARQGCSITMFTGRGFTGTSSTLSGNQCVSTYHLSTASSTDLMGWSQQSLPCSSRSSRTSSPREPHLAVSASSSLATRATTAAHASMTPASAIWLGYVKLDGP